MYALNDLDLHRLIPNNWLIKNSSVCLYVFLFCCCFCCLFVLLLLFFCGFFFLVGGGGWGLWVVLKWHIYIRLSSGIVKVKHYGDIIESNYVLRTY